MSRRNYGFPITLAMIVKNESKIIERCLDSVKEHITGWVIIDTGSTDGTQEIIKESLQGIPGTLLERPWVDFGYNRSELCREASAYVRLHRGALNNGYLLLFDADHVLEGDFSGVGDADGYLIKLVGAPIEYSMPYMVAAEIPWKYFCRTHEYLGTEGVPFVHENLDSCQIRHFGDGGTRHEKFERDLKLLEEDFESDPNDDRTCYYLAQTLEGLGQTERAIELFRRRAELGGWDQEVFWALFRAAELTGKPEDYFTAWLNRPSRSEPLHRIIKFLNEQEQHEAAAAVARLAPQKQSEDHFFVERWVEEYGLAFETCLALWYTGHVDTARDGWEAILKIDDLPDGFRESCIRNLEFC